MSSFKIHKTIYDDYTYNQIVSKEELKGDELDAFCINHIRNMIAVARDYETKLEADVLMAKDKLEYLSKKIAGEETGI